MVFIGIVFSHALVCTSEQVGSKESFCFVTMLNAESLGRLDTLKFVINPWLTLMMETLVHSTQPNK